MRMHELLERNASRAPEKICIFSESRSITNREASDAVQRVASGFRSLGVKKGDRVLIFAPNSIDFVLAMFAAFKLGAIATCIDVLDLPSYHRNAKRLAPKLVISTSEHSDELKKSSPRTAKFISFDSNKEFDHSWQRLLTHQQGKIQSDFGENAACHLSFTSGTTYEPKPAVLSHEPTVRATRCIAERLGLTRDDTTIGVTTLSSSHILVYAILPQMHRMATAGIMESWDPAQAWRMIHDHQVRLISGTAIRLSELADYAKEHGIRKGNLRLILSGGSAGIGKIREKWERLGVRFVETYGMSELGGSVAMGHPRPFESKPIKSFDSVPAIGPPLPDKEVKIVDERGREVPIGTPGEILITGGFMWGYWRMPKETAKATRGGWLHTSDVGFMDEFDNVYWLARKTDIIHTARGPIYPRVIEETLFSHKSVRQASVVGLGESGHQNAVGFVTLFEGKSVDEEELLSHCRSVLAQEFWPSTVVIKSRFPMTPTGKIDKKQFKQERVNV
jgi:acyl-CoA synthetase (AMP-forming)/AMP-acid ligase II